VLERDHGYELPRWLQIDFSATVQAYAEEQESEVQSEAIHDLFQRTYLAPDGRWTLGDYQLSRADHVDQLTIVLNEGRQAHQITGTGNGVVAAFVDAMERFTGKPIVLVEYNEHALSQSADAEAVCYIQLNIDGERVCGVGRSHDIVQASMNGILGALNRAAATAAVAAA